MAKRSRSIRSTSTIVSDYSEDDSEESSSATRDSCRPPQKRRYKQSYRSEWEKIPELSGWLSRSSTNNKMAFCKLCNCNLEAKLKEVVDAHAHNILELDVANEDHHLSNDQLFVGVATRRFIDSCDEIDVHQLTPFFSNCRNYFIAAIQEIRKSCPLDDPLLKLLSFPDPHQCKQVQLSNILQVAKRFPNVIKEEDIE
uniref:Uncharacterized protein n=1 Tax=Amphimedon queenslandica TaxID=400682 RepID=A0A1X7U9S8_AMPQE